MHTLSLFPSLLDFGIFAPLLLRLVVGIFMISLGKDRYKKEYSWSAVAYFIVGIFAILGLYTQAVAIAGIAVLKFDFYVDYWKNRNLVPVEKNKYFLYALSGLILLSLLLSGAGAPAFDLPL